MKILLASPIRATASDPHYFWLKALRRLKCQVQLFPLTGSSRLINSWRLFQTMVRFKHDEVFFSAGRDAVYPVKDTVFFCGVPPRWLSKSERVTGLLAKLVVTNDDRHLLAWKRLGAKKVINLPISAIDQKDFKARKLKRIFPVSFVGSLFADRQRQLARLVKAYPELKIWGALPPGVELLAELKHCYQGEAWGKKMAKIYQQSLIGLNLAPAHMRQGGNIRTFEIAASGALLLTNQLNLDWFGPGKEAIRFNSVSDCVKKINYYLKYRQRLSVIACAGRNRTFKDHTYSRHFQRLFKLL